jgi:hypothetical protein
MSEGNGARSPREREEKGGGERRRKRSRTHAKTVGDVSQAHVLARLIEHGKEILVPWGENQRYDLVIDGFGHFVRVQVKTGRLRKGSIVFNTCSLSYHHPSNQGTKQYRHDYRGDADLFGVYCPETRGLYLVPVHEAGKRSCALRVDPPHNNQSKKIRWARDYELPSVPPE